MSMLPRIIASHQRQIVASSWPPAFAAWSVRVPITVPIVGATLDDFPVYVNLSHMPVGFWSAVQNNGGDIRVTLDDGTTEVAREVVSCDTATETGELHFLADDNLSSITAKTYYIYAGNSGASDYATDAAHGAENVWGASYLLVSHDGGKTDSSQYRRTMTAINSSSPPTIVAGKVNEASDYNGWQNGYAFSAIDLNRQASTISMWARLSVADGYGGVEKPLNSSTSYNNYYGIGTGQLKCEGDINNRSYLALGSTTIGLNAWRHVATSFGTPYTSSSYVDGVFIEETSAYSDAANFRPSRIAGQGQASGDTYMFNGRIDELRLASVARSADWIAAEFANQDNPAGWYSIGAAEVNS